MVNIANIRRLKMKENGSLSKLPLNLNLLAISDLSEDLDDEKSTERTKKLNLEPTPELIVGLVLDDLIKQISEKSLDPGKHSFLLNLQDLC